MKSSTISYTNGVFYRFNDTNDEQLMSVILWTWKTNDNDTAWWKSSIAFYRTQSSSALHKSRISFVDTSVYLPHNKFKYDVATILLLSIIIFKTRYLFLNNFGCTLQSAYERCKKPDSQLVAFNVYFHSFSEQCKIGSFWHQWSLWRYPFRYDYIIR